MENLTKLGNFCVKTIPNRKLYSIKYDIIDFDDTKDVYANMESGFKSADRINIKLLCDIETKKVYECTMKINDCFSFDPGDTFAILVANRVDEITYVLNRLNLLHKADQKITITYNNQNVPQTFENTVFCHTLWHFLNNIYDIRCIPKKLLLRDLIEFTSNLAEKTRLQQLCSREGALEYETCIRQQNVTFLHILKAFPSCQPTLECLINHLPFLQPRAYSIINSPLEDIDNNDEIKTIKFAFTLVSIKPDIWFPEQRYGLCTGYLKSLIDKDPKNMNSTLKIFKRKNDYFKLPSPPLNGQHRKQILIFLAPGVGVAPYLSFLQHLNKLQENDNKLSNMLNNGDNIISNNEWLNNLEVWLFYGCRNFAQDFIYKKDLETLFFGNSDCKPLNCFTRVYLSFSRPDSFDCQDVKIETNELNAINGISNDTINIVEDKTNNDLITPPPIENSQYVCYDRMDLTSDHFEPCANYPKYIQDNLKLASHEIIPKLIDGTAKIYLTGDAKGISASIKKCLTQMFLEDKNLNWSEKECANFVKKMQVEHQFLEDTWI